jgi:hypothetical protein
MSDWFYENEIVLLKETGGGLFHGTWKEGILTPYKTISCDVQPASKDSIFKDYGYYIECTKRVFCDPDTEIVNDVIVMYNNEKFQIVKVIEWDDYYDVFMKEV